MADKIIHLRIDVSKINKQWLFKGEKGTYLDATLFYNEEQDQFESNGMIVQSVPRVVYEKEKDKPKNEKTKGEILGNAKVFGSAGNRESVPGSESSKSKGSTKKKEEEEDIDDDLPF